MTTMMILSFVGNSGKLTANRLLLIMVVISANSVRERSVTVHSLLMSWTVFWEKWNR